jgi:hypothetical protein
MTAIPVDRYSQPAMTGLQYTNAFVVQLRDDKDRSGRIEHVASGRTSKFQSLAELPSILERMLKESRRPDDSEG